MQILGLGAIMLILPVAVWGWRMLTHRPFDREALRLGCWILCTVIAAGFASCWPHGGAWPLPTGLGGVVGDALVRAPAVMFGPPGIDLSPRARRDPVRRDGRDLPDRLRLGLARARRRARGDRGRRRAVRRRRGERPRLGLAGLAVPRPDEREGAADLAALARPTARWSRARRRPRPLRSSRQEPNLGAAAPRRRWRRSPRTRIDEDEHEEEEDEEEEEEEPAARAPRKKAAPKAASKKSSGKFELPSVSVLAAPKAADRQPLSKAELEANSRALEGVLQDFGVRGEIVKANPGPVVTLYELEPAPGIKSSRVIGLADDIARSMSALSARVAVVPGRNAIGIELPNAHREKVYLRELLVAEGYRRRGREAAALPRQDHRRRAGHHRPRAHAASADRRHHRLGQVGRHQHHDPQPGLPAAPGPVPADHGRSEDARTLRL